MRQGTQGKNNRFSTIGLTSDQTSILGRGKIEVFDTKGRIAKFQNTGDSKTSLRVLNKPCMGVHLLRNTINGQAQFKKAVITQ